MKNIAMYKGNLNGEIKHNNVEQNVSSVSRSISINGKEFVVRVNSEIKDQKKFWLVVNKLNSNKQKIKDTEMIRELLKDIEDTFRSFEEWHAREKNLIFLKTEEIEHWREKKIKRKYISKEEYEKLHQKKYSLLFNLFHRG